MIIALALLVLHAVPLSAAADARAASGQSDIAAFQNLTLSVDEGQAGQASLTQQDTTKQDDCKSERSCTGAFAFLPGQDLTLPTLAFRRLNVVPPDAVGKGLVPARQMRPPRA